MKIKMELDKKGLTNQKERKTNKTNTHKSHTASTLRHADGGSNFYQA